MEDKFIKKDRVNARFSILLCVFFLIFGCIVFMRVIITENRPITQPEVYLILGLFVLSVLIFSFKEIFQGIVKKRVQEYLSTEEISKIIISCIKEELPTSISEAKEYEEREIEIAEETERSNDTLLDTLVVPSGLTQQWIRDYNIYFYPKKRKFKDTKYIAFYMNKKIWLAGERHFYDNKNISNLFNKEKIDEFEKEFGLISDHKFIQIKSPRPLKVWHNHSFAFVQNRRYVNFEKLNSINSTDELIIIQRNKQLWI